MSDKTILVVGTYDTKNDELEYMVERIQSLGGGALSMNRIPCPLVKGRIRR